MIWFWNVKWAVTTLIRIAIKKIFHTTIQYVISYPRLSRLQSNNFCLGTAYILPSEYILFLILQTPPDSPLENEPSIECAEIEIVPEVGS